MIRILVICIILVAIFGLLPGLTGISTIIEFALLSSAAVSLLLLPGKAQGTAAIPALNKKSDVFIVAFVVLWMVAALMHDSLGLPNLVALLRYVLLAYLVAKFFSYNDIKLVSWLVFYIAVSQIVIGALQLADLVPWYLADDFTEEKSGLYGVFKDNVSYAAVLLVGLIVYKEILARASSLKTLAISFVFLVFLLLSGSRAYFLGGLIYFCIAIIKIPMKLFWVGSGIGLVLLVAIGGMVGVGSSNEDFFFFLSSAYIDMAMHQRLGILLELLPQFLSSIDLFFGFGSDRDSAVAQIAHQYTFHYLSPTILTNIIEDVYWTALLLYYGLVGLAFFVIFLMGIYSTSRKIKISKTRHIGLLNVFNWLFFSAIILGLTGQVFELKAFSIFLWIYVGALLTIKRDENAHTAN